MSEFWGVVQNVWIWKWCPLWLEDMIFTSLAHEINKSMKSEGHLSRNMPRTSRKIWEKQTCPCLPWSIWRNHFGCLYLICSKNCPWVRKKIFIKVYFESWQPGICGFLSDFYLDCIVFLSSINIIKFFKVLIEMTVQFHIFYMFEPYKEGIIFSHIFFRREAINVVILITWKNESCII